MRKMSRFLFACSLLLIIFPTCGYAAINSSSPLSIGQILSSPAGFYELGFFSPNNTRNQYVGIWFKEIVPRVVVWVANRDTPVTKSAANLTISSNGRLILLEGDHDVIWSTGEAFTSNKCHAELLDTGNLVVIDDVSGKTLWQSFENLGNTMLPQSSLMYDTPHGKKRMLTTWKSDSDPSPGEFSLEITAQVPLQGLIRRGSVPYWRTGPWAKTRFTGLTQFDKSYVSTFSAVQDLATGTGTLTYSMLRNFNLSYTMVTSEGQIKIYWDDGKGWMHHFTAPESLCDFYGVCGPFGLCVRSTTPRCICLKGFVPKSDEEWRKGNRTSGCVRRTQLSCQTNSSMRTQGRDTDSFYRMTNVKTPDLHQFASFLNAEQCYEGCLGNCSCTAFSYISGIGCLVWNEELLDTVQCLSNGEILSIRLASSELAGSSRTKILVGTTVSLSIFMILVFAAYMYWRYRATHNAINTPSPLSIGQTLSSPGGFYEIGFFSPNNTRNQYVGIWFKKIVPRVVVWVANRDKPVTSSAANLTININGSLVLLGGKQDVIWSTGRGFTSNKCHAELLDTGNFVVIDDVSGEKLWQSFENLGNTMLPQSSLMYDTSNGKKRVLTAWKSYSDPSPGEFSLEITPQIPTQGLIRRGSKPYWRCGPWAKTRFSGISGIDASYVKCECLKGFVPKSNEEWGKGNWTSGCVRRTRLSCQANSSRTTQGKDTDTFYRMTDVKTPDLHQFASFLNAEQCYQGCLGNCSCTAFAYISGIGCLVWNGELVDTVQFLSSGETLSIRIASSELAGSSRTKIIVGTAVSLSIFAILVFAAFMLWRYRAKRNDAWKKNLGPRDVSGVNFYEMHTIRNATNNFSSSNKLGQAFLFS